MMERLHTVFYQAFSHQAWLIVAFGLVAIELNEPDSVCFGGSKDKIR